jgi:hypothetical protein
MVKRIVTQECVIYDDRFNALLANDGDTLFKVYKVPRFTTPNHFKRIASAKISSNYILPGITKDTNNYSR